MEYHIICQRKTMFYHLTGKLPIEILMYRRLKSFHHVYSNEDLAIILTVTRLPASIKLPNHKEVVC